AQYSQYQPLPGEFTNGELTLGENIGDLGGLSMALRAYQLSLNGEEPPVLDGYTGYQRVFLGWAQGWRVKRRDELVRQLLKTGPHSQPEFRVNGVVVNIDGFHQAFDTQPGDGLYKPESERIRIW
ncbi:MAG: M13-type metalloendopeptidase, partial [Porticoccaceae bacterium]